MKIPFVNKDGEVIYMDLMDIESICRDEDSRRLIVKVEHDLYYVPSTIREVSLILAHRKFYRIDKNKIINMTKIDKYKNGIATIGDKDYIVSRRNRKGLEMEMNDN